MVFFYCFLSFVFPEIYGKGRKLKKKRKIMRMNICMMKRRIRMIQMRRIMRMIRI